MWEFYLAGSEVSFRYLGLNNFQLQITRSQHVLPLTRNYIEAEEQRLREIERKQPRFKSISGGRRKAGVKASARPSGSARRHGRG